MVVKSVHRNFLKAIWNLHMMWLSSGFSIAVTEIDYKGIVSNDALKMVKRLLGNNYAKSVMIIVSFQLIVSTHTKLSAANNISRSFLIIDFQQNVDKNIHVNTFNFSTEFMLNSKSGVSLLSCIGN